MSKWHRRQLVLGAAQSGRSPFAQVLGKGKQHFDAADDLVLLVCSASEKVILPNRLTVEGNEFLAKSL
jgi:hypothetical protein